MTLVWLHKTKAQLRGRKYGIGLALTTLRQLLAPYSHREEERRREYIFNIITLMLILLTSITLIVIIYLELTRSKINGVNIPIISATWLSLGATFVLGKTYYRRYARQLLLILILLPCLYTLATRGLQSTIPLLGCALAIVMAGILHNTRIAFVYTSTIVLSLGIIYWGSTYGLIQPDQSWAKYTTHNLYWVELSVMLFFLLTVTWLTEREINHSFLHTKDTEDALIAERNQLEVRLEERTSQLAKIHAEQTADLLRLANYGQEFAGYFHDLVNPITAASISLEKVSQSPTAKDPLLDKAGAAMQTVIDFINAVQKQLSKEEKSEPINLTQAVTQATEIVQHKLRHHSIILYTQVSQDGTFIMNPLRLFQILSNLLNNAAEACSENRQKQNKIWLNATINTDGLSVEIIDTGPGIRDEIKLHLFKPLTTSKESKTNTGLGLSIVHHIINHEYGGSITVDSGYGGKGAKFSVFIPRKIPT